MHQHPYDLTWLDSSETMNIVELSRACGLDTGELAELVEYGALTPLSSDTEETVFNVVCVAPLRKVCRLRVDYDLDLFTLAVLMGYLNRIEELERQLQALESSGGMPSDD